MASYFIKHRDNVTITLPRHEDVLGSRGKAPHILKRCTLYR